MTPVKTNGINFFQRSIQVQFQFFSASQIMATPQVILTEILMTQIHFRTLNWIPIMKCNSLRGFPYAFTCSQEELQSNGDK